jgi:hypothetical protein
LRDEIELSKALDSSLDFLGLGLIDGAIVDYRIGASAKHERQQQSNHSRRGSANCRALQSVRADHHRTILSVISARGIAIVHSASIHKIRRNERYSVMITAA